MKPDPVSFGPDRPSLRSQSKVLIQGLTLIDPG
jgi:hypothetical protein